MAHIDVAGWYEATPDETVVITKVDMRPDTLLSSFPYTLLDWHDGEELGTDADIEKWYDGPDVVMRREYHDDAGHVLWITAIYSRGAKSFHVFEHTPHTCYPSADWIVESQEVRRIALAEGSLPINYGVFRLGDTRRVVYYWYQWENPEREAGQGVSSWRLTTDAPDGIAAAEKRLDEAVQLLFDRSLAWRRF
jgi:hypothetical protein